MSGPLRSLRMFRALSGPDRGLFLAAWVAMPVFWVGLRVLGLQRWLVWVGARPLAARSASETSLEQVREWGRLVNAAAARPPYPRACLARSLVLLWLLRGRGVDARLRIGVRFIDRQLDAHAWVEWAGQPVNDRPDVGGTFADMGELVPMTAFHSP
jgi:Transglutaminase-like superfamily